MSVNEIEDESDADSVITHSHTDNIIFDFLTPTVQTVGLDPLFRTCMKLFVRDIFLLKCINDAEWKGTSGIFSYGNHVVNRVEIMGIIVRIDKREKHNTYAVDDGTGVINCTCWKNSRITSCPQGFTDKLPLSLQTKLGELVTYNQSNLLDGYELGDLVLICGRVTEFRDHREISVMTHRRIDNPNAEVERMSKLISYYDIYNQPFTLGPKLQRQLEKSSMGDSLFDALKNGILEILNRPGCEIMEFAPKDVLTWPPIAGLIPERHCVRTLP
ncbi:telomere cap complex subunit Stn1 [Bulinus truncatus]|nr:telomere cap complex subunit Stn1 [Bulinus truncatus]